MNLRLGLGLGFRELRKLPEERVHIQHARAVDEEDVVEVEGGQHLLKGLLSSGRGLLLSSTLNDVFQEGGDDLFRLQPGSVLGTHGVDGFDCLCGGN